MLYLIMGPDTDGYLSILQIFEDKREANKELMHLRKLAGKYPWYYIKELAPGFGQFCPGDDE